MRLTEFKILGVSGVSRFEVSGLSDIVVLAGPNGVGKTRIISTLINFLRSPKQRDDLSVSVEATSDAELRQWGKATLSTNDPQDVGLLRATLQKNQKRSHYVSTVLNFDSNRAISQVQPYTFSWDVHDPSEEEIGWDTSFGFLRDRFQDLQHSLFRLVESQKRKVSDQAFDLMKRGQKTMELDFPDPLEKFKNAFSQLLAPKALLDLDVRDQRIYYSQDGEKRDISSLSSGEREVVNIVFDFLFRNPSDCIVFFDEPELHLHPELSYRLLQALSTVGKRNQFVLCTHSPEIITASIENSVVFVRPSKGPDENQAIPVLREDETNQALNLLGQSIGIISLGKKLLLIEGEESSLDKQTYGAILKNEFPELVLVPVGGRSAIRAFDEIKSAVLDRTIWGVEFFMLCDRDAEYAMGSKSLDSRISTRLRRLPRYHLENYFLDPPTLSAVFQEMEGGSDSWLKSATAVEEVLHSLAESVVPYGVALKVSALVRESMGNVDVMPKKIGVTQDELIEALKARISAEQTRLRAGLDEGAAIMLAVDEYEKLAASIKGNTDYWRFNLPGRVVLNRFAARANLQVGRLKTLYLARASEMEKDPFEEVRQLFRTFKAASA